MNNATIATLTASVVSAKQAMGAAASEALPVWQAARVAHAAAVNALTIAEAAGRMARTRAGLNNCPRLVGFQNAAS